MLLAAKKAVASPHLASGTRHEIAHTCRSGAVPMVFLISRGRTVSVSIALYEMRQPYCMQTVRSVLAQPFNEPSN